MATKKKQPEAIYQLKVTLAGSKPPIWRRLLVPADMTLGTLHVVLQVAMGWTNSHLHDFDIDSVTYGEPNPEDRAMGLTPTRNERTVRLSRVLGYVGSRGTYTYDFGDGWEHKLLVEKILPPVPGYPYPACIAGKRNCPPEDCGGVGGYENLLEILADPDHEDHEEQLEWVGGRFDPEAFDIIGINEVLANLQRRQPGM
jgi:hypothetical protein